MSVLRYISSFWRDASMRGKISVIIVLAWILVALLSPYIASNELLLSGLHSPIGYSYSDVLGSGSSLLPPLSKSMGGIHWLGTDTIGRDVAASMVHGARVSFIISLLVIISSVLIGLLIGMVMGYFGDRDLSLNIPQYILLGVSVFYLAYYKTDLLLHGMSWWSAGMVVLSTIFLFLGWLLLGRINIRKFALPLDLIGQRIFELKESLPNLFLLLAVAAIVARPTIWTLAFTLMLLFWVTFARFARAEMQRIKDEDYITAAIAEGVSTYRLFLYHALPNMLSPILVVIAFSLSGVILIEASLSFLGIGLPLQEVTWGKLLAEARHSSSAWWLAVFPGLAIFALVFAFNTIADMVRDSKD